MHPSILISDNRKAELKEKIAHHAWAKTIYDNLVSSVRPYIDRHETDPEWIVSRLQMHWKTHYERTFVKGARWSHGEGRAPVPTVRFAGARDWATDYQTPALEDLLPYSEDSRGIWLQNGKKPGEPWEWADVSVTGHIVEGINERIMDLAEKAAFLYWFTGDLAAARFAVDILWPYVLGMHHRQNPDTFEDHSQAHILGIATFEVIHERITTPLTVAYDFLYPHLIETGEDVALIQNLFKRWADRIIEGGFAQGNWNLHQAKYLVGLALALEPDKAYEDGRGQEHYLAQFTHVSSANQACVEDVISEQYDQETGVWPESPGYAFGVTDNILRLAQLVYNATGEDLVARYPLLEKAALLIFQYLFPNGRTVGFGDTNHNVPPAVMSELLIARARRIGDLETERRLTLALKRQMERSGYRRDEERSLFALTAYVDELVEGHTVGENLATRTFFAKSVNVFIQRNGDHPRFGLMASLSGTEGGHAHASGMALELYGQGLIQGADPGNGVSYWQKEHAEYYARFPAHNTVVVDGISHHHKDNDRGTFKHVSQILDVEPEPGVRRALSQDVSFVDVVFHETKTDADQRRLVALVRTSAETGYYVDIFRSRRRDGEDRKHEYLYHNLGQSLTLYDDSGEPLNSQPTAELGSAHGDLVGYDYFTEKQAVTHDGDFTGRFRVVLEESPDVDMRVWMGGCPGRTLFAVKAPWARTTRSGSAPPELQNVPMPTLVVRQEGEAWDRPFVAIYEPGEEGSDRSSIRQILSGDCVALAVESGVEEGFADVVLNAIEGDVTHTVENITFKGIFGVIRQREGRVESLYLGAGEHVSCEGCGMESVGGRASAFLARLGDAWTLSATGNMRVWLPVPKGTVELEVVCQVGGKTDVLPGKLENGSVVCEVGPIWDAVLRPRFETR